MKIVSSHKTEFLCSLFHTIAFYLKEQPIDKPWLFRLENQAHISLKMNEVNLSPLEKQLMEFVDHDKIQALKQQLEF